MSNRIIGLTGKAGSGKDTVAEYLIQQGYIKLSFGSALKDIVSIITGWPRDFIEGTSNDRNMRETLKHPDYKKTCREIMQFVGTDLFRNQFDDNVWINIIKNKIKMDDTSKYVITDVRFDNEAIMIESIGGIIIQINRDNTIYNSNHVSEKGIKLKPLYVIDNNGSKDELYDKICVIIK
jgi:dephospho-CoA kinase